MAKFDVAVVGTGDPDGDGFAMAYRHAEGYESLDSCKIVACCDLVEANAAAFADEHGIPPERVFTDTQSMVAGVEPDIVSVCVPPSAHVDVVTSIVRAGPPLAVHCEKPMAETWGGAQEMAERCWAADVQLTFNHQRRFGAPFRKAKALLEKGRIGKLRRVEFAAPNLYDYGTHSFDLSNYFVNEGRAEWVLGALDYREENRWFGTHNENQGLAQWQYRSGVQGIAATGEQGSPAIGCHNRLVGETGMIEIGVTDGPTLQLSQDGATEVIDIGEEDQHGPGYVSRAVADIVTAVETEADSELRAENALAATEIIFAAYESVRQRGRVELPLEIADNPLIAMVEDGDLHLESGDN